VNVAIPNQKEKEKVKEIVPDFQKDYSKVELRRVVVFCDHANIFHNLLERKMRIDYKRFRELLTGDYHLVTAVMFMGFPQELFEKKKRLIRALDKTGWIVIPCPIARLPNGSIKQDGVDEEMLQLITQFACEDYYEKAVIISGDRIFVKAIKYLQDLNKLVEVWSFRRSLSRQLIEVIGEENIYYIDDVLEHIRL